MKIASIAIALATLFASPYAMSQEAEAKAVPTNPSSSVPKGAKIGPTTVTVDLVGAQKITGAIVDLANIPFRSSIGSVEINMAEIAGVKFASADDAMTTIILKNGDSITGATDLKTLTVDTDWGQARINGSSISSILMIPDLKWNATMTMNGKRWSLVDSKNPGQLGPNANAPGTAGSILPQANVTRPSGTQPGRNQ